MVYDVVRSSNLTDLISWVNERIKFGWTPLGGFAKDSSNYYQAVVKK